MKSTKTFKALKNNPIATEPLGLGAMVENSQSFKFPKFQVGEYVLMKANNGLKIKGIVNCFLWNKGEYNYSVTELRSTFHLVASGLLSEQFIEKIAIDSHYWNFPEKDRNPQRFIGTHFINGDFDGYYIVFEGEEPPFGDKVGTIPKVYEIQVPKTKKGNLIPFDKWAKNKLIIKRAFSDNQGNISSALQEQFEVTTAQYPHIKTIPFGVAKILLTVEYLHTEFGKRLKEILNDSTQLDKKDFMQRRFYLFEYDTIENFESFCQEIKKHSEEAAYFRADFGQFYLNILGVVDGNEDLKIKTFQDIIFEYRKKGIVKIKEYLKKPTPEKRWKGEWIKIK
jgi:hypothetical protein